MQYQHTFQSCASCAPSELALQLQSKRRQMIGALLLRWERTKCLPFCSHSPNRHQWPNWIKRSPNLMVLMPASRSQVCQSLRGPEWVRPSEVRIRGVWMLRCEKEKWCESIPATRQSLSCRKPSPALALGFCKGSKKASFKGSLALSLSLSFSLSLSLSLFLSPGLRVRVAPHPRSLSLSLSLSLFFPKA